MPIFKSIYTLLVISCVLLLYISCEIFDMILSYNNIYNLTQNCCLTFTHIAGIFKVLNMLIRKQKLLRMVELLQTMSDKYAVTADQILEIKRTEKLVKTITALFASLVFGTAVLGCMTNFAFDNNTEKTFPFRVYLPTFIPKILIVPFYWCGVTWNAMLIVTHDCLFMGLMNYICAHLRILELSMIPLADKNVKRPTDKFISCIEHHQLIVKFTSEVETFFTNVVFCQFITSMIITGLTAFQITIAESLDGAQLTIIAYLACISSELFIYCWFANQIIEQVIFYFIGL